jgi:hypothetical protein
VSLLAEKVKRLTAVCIFIDVQQVEGQEKTNETTPLVGFRSLWASPEERDYLVGGE